MQKVRFGNKESKSHVYDKRQTSDSSWEFLRIIENKQVKTVEDNSYGLIKEAWNYLFLCGDNNQ